MSKKLLVKNKYKITLIGGLFISLVHLIIFMNSTNITKININLAQDYNKNQTIYVTDDLRQSFLFAQDSLLLKIKKKFKLKEMKYHYNKNEFHVITKNKINLEEFLNYFEKEISAFSYKMMKILNEQNKENSQKIINKYDFNKNPKKSYYMEILEVYIKNLDNLNKKKKIHYIITTDIQKLNLSNNILIIFLVNIFLYFIFIKTYFKK